MEFNTDSMTGGNFGVLGQKKPSAAPRNNDGAYGLTMSPQTARVSLMRTVSPSLVPPTEQRLFCFQHQCASPTCRGQQPSAGHRYRHHERLKRRCQFSTSQYPRLKSILV